MAASNKMPKTDNGVIVPLVTPLTADRKLDEAALRRLIDHLVAGGVQGVFVLGTTGEGPSVPRAMRARVVHVAVDQANRRIRVYAGIGDTSMSDTVAAAVEYRRLGVDVLVAPLPGYYRLTPDEQFHYYSDLAECVSCPLLLYDIPSATHNPLDLRVVEHLRVFQNVVGIKDSSGDQERLSTLLNAYAGDSEFSVLVGDTSLATFGLKRGADGFVPSTANLEPGLCVRLCAAAETGDWALMEELQRQIDELTAAFMSGATTGQGIARLKKLMNERGLCGVSVFPPLIQAV